MMIKITITDIQKNGLNKITSRYDVHVTCESLDYIDKICNEIVCSNSECEYYFADKCKKFLENENIEISKMGCVFLLKKILCMINNRIRSNVLWQLI